MRCVPQLDDLNVAAIAPKFIDFVPPMFLGLASEGFESTSAFLRESPDPIFVSIHRKKH